MAHFAELNSSNEVLQVIVISNDDVDANGGDQHADAETFVASIVPFLPFGGAWKQTSYNNNFRKQYAGIGYTYNASKNKFLTIQPYASWALDGSDDWQAPITYPSVIDDGEETPSWIYNIKWNETKYNADNDTGWEAIKSNDTSDPKTVYNWNGSAWVSE